MTVYYSVIVFQQQKKQVFKIQKSFLIYYQLFNYISCCIIYKLQFRQFFLSLQNLTLNSMWRKADANKIVGTQIKVESYKNHLTNLKKAKSILKIQEPWKPSFSLSKRKNKYYKYIQQKIDKQNANLLGRMMQIEAQPMSRTVNYIPLTIPSNKQTFSELKLRERKAQQFSINKENMKVLSKIQNVSSEYGQQVWRPKWKQNIKYKDNISRKQSVPDYYELARQMDIVQKSRISRPRTAHPHC